MSTIKVSNLQNASAASPAFVLASDGSATANLSSLNGGPISGARNRIINGDMRIDQRNAGASVSTDNAFPVDRFQIGKAGTQTWTMQRSTTAPSGFSNSVAVVIGTGSTPAATDRLTLVQAVEGYNLADLSFGSASAQSIAMSFWVRSSLTGTFGVAFRNGVPNKTYVASYSVLAANTWEYKSLMIAGDTSGTWAVDNTVGIYVNFDLGCGTTFSTTAGSWQAGNFLGLTGGTKLNATSGATFYLTGVQLELGTVATPFERRSYGQELALCQRYCFVQQATGANYSFGVSSVNSTLPMGLVAFPAPMRTAPTSATLSAANTFTFASGAPGAVAFDSAGETSGVIYGSGGTGGSAGFSGRFMSANSSAKIIWSSEL